MGETQFAIGESWRRWAHEVRRIQFECMMPQLPLSPDVTVLELGSGDGFQLGLLRRRFSRVFGVDPEFAPANASGFCFARAEELPFPDCTFDLVFSCAVAEHMQDRSTALEEALRVLRPGGFMVHIVPTRFWKGSSLALHPIGYPLRVAEKWRESRRSSSRAGKFAPRGGGTGERPGLLEVVKRWFCPPIHGTFPSHWAEFRSYARKRWLKVFSHPMLICVADSPVLACTQFGLLRFRLMGLRKWLAKHGISNTRVFILRKQAATGVFPESGLSN